MCLPGSIRSHEHIESLTEFKFGIGENGEIAEVQAF